MYIYKIVERPLTIVPDHIVEMDLYFNHIPDDGIHVSGFGGSVFTEPLSRSGLHNPVVPLLVSILLRSGSLCDSAVLAWDKYSTTFSSEAVLKNIISCIVSAELLPRAFNPFNFSHRVDPSVFHCCFSGLSEVKKS
jgi:hypothetical protein